MQKKILKVMMCAITTMTLLAGCGNSNTESTIGSTGGTVADSTEDKAETANFTGTKLVIGVESGSPNIEFFKNNVSEFETATGITIEWVEIPHDNMHESLCRRQFHRVEQLIFTIRTSRGFLNLLLKDIWSRWEINFQRKIKVISMKLH